MHLKPPFAPLLIATLLISATCFGQPSIGFKKLNVWTSFAFAKPKDAMANSYSYGKPMQLYYGADLPFTSLRYGKKTNTGLSVAVFADHERANFDANDFNSEGLNAKLFSLGVRIRPFANMAIYAPKGEVIKGQYVEETLHKEIYHDSNNNIQFREYTTTTSLPLWTDEGAKLLVTMLLSGLYVDFGVTHASLIEKPSPDVTRTARVISYGCAPSIGVGRKVTAFMDFDIRKYTWTNSMKTTSSIGSFHCGFGLGFNL
jgi:hypothetical protein